MATVFGTFLPDKLHGTNASDHIYGFGGNDQLSGGGGADRLDGGTGNDTLNGGGGADVLVGGYDIDTVDYGQSPANGQNGGVAVFLGQNVAWYGDAEGDTFSGIENITGSPYRDRLGGDESFNVLRGMNGDDQLSGEGGNDRLEGGADNDRLEGGHGNDTLDGGGGADILVGIFGVDTLIGGTGNDTYYVAAGSVVTESAGEGSDTVGVVFGSYALSPGADVEYLLVVYPSDTAALDLTGNSSGNVIGGNDGANVIGGGGGNDELTGLGGQDYFRFDTPLSAVSNVDVITDFTVGDDTIQLDDIIFAAFANGPLADDRFVVGTAALDANDNILYNPATGALLYDSDGNGAAAAVQFATLNGLPALTHLDFVVV
jgi:serralysin